MSDINPSILPSSFPILAGNLKPGQNCSVTFYGSRYLLERTGAGRFDLKATFIEDLQAPVAPPVRYCVRRALMLDFPSPDSDSWQPDEYETAAEAMRAAEALGLRNGQSEAVYIGWTGGSNGRGCTEFAVCRPGRGFGTWREWEIYEFGQPEA